MSVLAVVLTWLAVAIPLTIEAMQARRALENTLVRVRHLPRRRAEKQPRRPGRIPGANWRDALRSGAWWWGRAFGGDANATAMIGDLKVAQRRKERLTREEQSRRDRSREIDRLGKVHAHDAQIGPLVRRSWRWTAAAVVAWTLLLPVLMVVVPAVDPLVATVVPVLEEARVPLLVVGVWATWFVARRRWSIRP
jgi:hypothetical protein